MSDLFEATAPERDDAEVRRARREHRRARDARRKRRRRRSAVVLFVTVALLAALSVWAVPRVTDLVRGTGGPEDYPGPGSGEAVVVIQEGSTGQEIGTVLHEADVVASVRAFTDAFKENVNAPRIQPGTYALLLQMPARDAVAALLDPANKSEVTITVPEGFHAKQVYERIANVAGIPLEEVQAAAADPAGIGLPAEAGGNPEGWLAAATYSFQPGDDAREILGTMVELTVARLDKRGVPVEERQQVLIEASIVEREVNLPEYYGQVARVIENRITNGGEVAGRLQMDSTVLYGVGKVGGVPTQEDLDNDNPYNTYMHAGLPPTAIGAPGEAAIDAVVDPPPGDWLYFATVNLETGETKFAATLQEHNANVAELRKYMAENPQ
ncbi:endolytic transglycosylase MltG [Georgenia yuyongxinii]|uniref:Endolytic murein transglycosylase n=1 Tax=Georgenia yuyongxinii TaxID=2589797 RepID=A0A552WJT9_9MICO|nr:endolytic transglycosylase MltG [Georgenia yuyongxinii]TRW43022.1 endolytic transglycosylase MltG [Georgenia yuyongxinii]